MQNFLVKLFLVRVPMLVLVLMTWGVSVLFDTELFRGLTDIQDWQIATASLFAFLVVSAAIAVANLVLLYGDIRINGIAGPVPRAQPPHPWLVFGLGFAAYLDFLFTVRSKGGLPELSFVFWSAAGLALGVLSVLGLTVLQEVFGLPIVGAGPYLVIPFHKIPIVNKILECIANSPSPLEWPVLSQAAAWGFRALAPLLGPGYLQYAPSPGGFVPTALLPGVPFLLWLFLFSAVIHTATGWRHFHELLTYDFTGPASPTVSYLLALLLVGCWLFAALAYYLDRYRTDVFLVLGIYILAVSYIGNSERVRDHLYETQELRAKAAFRTPAQWVRDSGKGIILIAANGGGIQSGAWTTQVLGGLSLQVPGFDSHVKLVSGTSGGAVGALFYAMGLKNHSMQDAIRASTGSSLEAVSWGLAHPDLMRILWPKIEFPPWLVYDRSWALERMLGYHSTFRDAPMGDLTAPGFPAIVLNATRANTGSPMVFSNAAFPDPATREKLASDITNFHDTHPYQDVRVATAVRLSATFPYVSLAAYAQCCPRDYDYLVDGGYYDNPAQHSVVAWLRQAMAGADLADSRNRAREIFTDKQVLILRTNAFPEDAAPKPEAKGWFYQVIAPIDALYNARAFGQVFRDNEELSLLQEEISALLGDEKDHIQVVDFRYDVKDACECPEKPPLSWHLTRIEVNCIEKAWSRQGENVAKVEKFLR